MGQFVDRPALPPARNFRPARGPTPARHAPDPACEARSKASFLAIDPLGKIEGVFEVHTVREAGGRPGARGGSEARAEPHRQRAHPPGPAITAAGYAGMRARTTHRVGPVSCLSGSLRAALAASIASSGTSVRSRNRSSVIAVISAAAR
jgi:hypothetical protein